MIEQSKPIANIIRTSLIDWKDHISSSIFFQGCNMNCHYCHSDHLIDNNEGLFSYDEALEIVRRQDKCSGVVLTGGEPVCHKGLFGFISNLKEIGKYVKLDTNATLVDEIINLASYRLIDHVDIDIKMEMNPSSMTRLLSYLKITKTSYRLRATVTHKNIEAISHIVDMYKYERFDFTKAEVFCRDFDMITEDDLVRYENIKLTI